MNNLTIKSIKDGMEKIILNSQSLVEEGYLLYDAGYFPRAYTLAHLAREEMAKVVMLYRIGIEIIGGKSYDSKKINKRFHAHKSKVELFSPLHPFINTDKANKRKNDSLYVGYEHDLFKSPKDVITEHIAHRTLELARMRVLHIAVVSNVLEMLEYAECMSPKDFEKAFGKYIHSEPKEWIDALGGIEAVTEFAIKVEELAWDKYKDENKEAAEQ